MRAKGVPKARLGLNTEKSGIDDVLDSIITFVSGHVRSHVNEKTVSIPVNSMEFQLLALGTLVGFAGEIVIR